MLLPARQLDRIRKKMLVKVEGETCVMEDISKTGMRLISSILFKKQEVDIDFQIDDMTIELRGSVRWIQKKPTVYDQAQYQIGVFLLNPPYEYGQVVEKLLEE